MNFKKSMFVLGIIVLFVSMIAVSAVSSQQNVHDIQEILDTTNESDMIGCCSIVLQLEGNNSMMAFRRDSGSAAEIYIEKIPWHGKEAIKQYKTSDGYFCQVIITNDGWLVGYGGIDDGPDNEKIENLTGNMINKSNGTISEDLLSQVQQIKSAYGLGHLLIKAPNGEYGIASATSYFKGKLAPGEYASIPNRDQFFRSGTIELNSSDKVRQMVNLELTDGFGLTRRDVTTFNYQVGNESNVTDIYISNDDGSYWGMGTSGLVDNVNMSGTYVKAADIPIAPDYKHIGNITFEDNKTDGNSGNFTMPGLGGFDYFGLLMNRVLALVLIVVAFVAYHIVRVLRYNKYRR
ncbi:hypothetical protein [Methanobrevibacter sp.]|uniref:hypothetical protein n=1 Tax=Methanobrevibacter sp. TaxID=66852 RepID=UPI00388E636C